MSKKAVFTFGRFQPPTVGHETLIDKTVSHAAETGGHHFVYVSNTQDAKKNPLSSSDKVDVIKAAKPGVNVVAASKETPTFMHVAKKLHDQGYEHLTMVAGSDRVPHYQELLNKYNGKEFNFKSINVISAGERDEKAAGVKGMSGTKMRQAAVSGDAASFKSGLMSGLTDDQKTAVFKKVRQGLNMSESVKRIPFLLMTEEQKLAMIKSYSSKPATAEAPVLKEEKKFLSFKIFRNKNA